jgi:hypothetical protein
VAALAMKRGKSVTSQAIGSDTFQTETARQPAALYVKFFNVAL